MRCDQVGQVLGRLEVAAVEHRGRSGGQHQRTVDPSGNPQRHDEPRLALSEDEVVGLLP
jgi:hypothetical protein